MWNAGSSNDQLRSNRCLKSPENTVKSQLLSCSAEWIVLAHLSPSKVAKSARDMKAVCQLRWDQGTNFVGAKNEFKEDIKQCDTEALKVLLADKLCEFPFNAPSASHAGSVWEWNILTICSVLNVTIAQCSGRLDNNSLRTHHQQSPIKRWWNQWPHGSRAPDSKPPYPEEI